MTDDTFLSKERRGRGGAVGDENHASRGIRRAPHDAHFT